MISFFRRWLSSWIVLALLGLVMVAFIITGVGSPGGPIGGGGDSLVTVEDETVTAPEVTNYLGRQLNRVQQEQPEADLPSLIRAGAFEQILSQVITSKVLAIFGREQGIVASKKMIDGQIASIPAFRGVTGQFDEEVFRRALQAEKVTEQELRDDFAAAMVQRQLLVPVGAATKIPEGVARQYAALLLETRAGSVGLVPAEALGPGRAPTDAELSAFYQKYRDRYMIPERRVLRYATFGRPDIAAAAKASDADIQAFYNANTATYGPKETRTLSQVVLPDQRAAQAFAAKLAAGKTFAQAATEAGFSAADTALGAQTRADVARLASPAVANAAFAAASGATIPPVQSPLGWHIVRVDAINRTPGKPLAAVRDEIAAQVEQQKAEQALNGLITQIEDAVGDGASFDEVLRANKLQAQQTAPLTASGDAPGVANYQMPAEAGALLKSASDMSPDDDPVVETIAPGQRFALLTVSRVIPAAAPPLAQIRDAVLADLLRQRAAARAKAVATALLAKINAGVPMRQAFTEAGMRLPPVESVRARRMDIARGGAQVPPPLAMIFSLPKGKAKLLPTPGGIGWLVVKLDEVIPGDIDNAPGLVEATRSQFGQVVGAEYAEQFSRAVQRELDVERDQAAIDRLKRRLQSGGASN